MTRRLRLNDFPLDRLYLHICGSLFYTRLHKYNDFLTFLDNFLGCDESVFIIYILPLILVNDKEKNHKYYRFGTAAKEMLIYARHTNYTQI